jgi:UDP-3-O-[3-hydroxymyristoyl] glucosamine N-acyltransferase
MKDAQIGANCILGQNVPVSSGVVIGNNVKIRNSVAIYTGTVIEDDVFLGPSRVLTNVSNPRSQIIRHDLYERTVLRRGATVGANATIVCGTELGHDGFIGRRCCDEGCAGPCPPVGRARPAGRLGESARDSAAGRATGGEGSRTGIVNVDRDCVD